MTDVVAFYYFDIYMLAQTKVADLFFCVILALTLEKYQKYISKLQFEPYDLGMKLNTDSTSSLCSRVLLV